MSGKFLPFKYYRASGNQQVWYKEAREGPARSPHERSDMRDEHRDGAGNPGFRFAHPGYLLSGLFSIANGIGAFRTPRRVSSWPRQEELQDRGAACTPCRPRGAHDDGVCFGNLGSAKREVDRARIKMTDQLAYLGRNLDVRFYDAVKSVGDALEGALRKNNALGMLASGNTFKEFEVDRTSSIRDDVQRGRGILACTRFR